MTDELNPTKEDFWSNLKTVKKEDGFYLEGRHWSHGPLGTKLAADRIRDHASSAYHCGFEDGCRPVKDVVRAVNALLEKPDAVD